MSQSKSEHFLKGYSDAKATDNSLLQKIEAPSNYDNLQRVEYTSGLLRGIKDKLDDELIDDIMNTNWNEE